MEEAEQLSIKYLLQDARCPHTQRVSNKLCSAISDISAPLSMDITPDAMKKKLSILLRVAQFHAFHWLESSIKELLAA
jgi:hypothetical protein